MNVNLRDISIKLLLLYKLDLIIVVNTTIPMILLVYITDVDIIKVKK